MKREKLTARKANIDRLYEESVQCPEFEVSFIKKIIQEILQYKMYKSKRRFLCICIDLIRVGQRQ